MAHYAIGDLQGCLAEFQALLATIGFNRGADTLWLTGDIVNRGPQSLATLRLIKQHENCMQTVLGNHDLHLIAQAFGYGKAKKSDTVADILNAPDRLTLIDWLRIQPMLVSRQHHIMVHAGIWPGWDIATAQTRAAEIEAALQAPKPSSFFAHMYGNTPSIDSDALSEQERLRFSTNVFTRMRAITVDGHMDFDFKSTLADIPPHCYPWFAAPQRQQPEHIIVFGHWSALGLYQGHGVIGLDTGALWGGCLTAINLDNGEIHQVPSQTTLSWAKKSNPSAQDCHSTPCTYG